MKNQLKLLSPSRCLHRLLTRLGQRGYRPIAILLLAALSFSCAANLTPAQRYAREHRSREFRSWEDQAKKDKKADTKKVKDHWKIKHTW